MTNRTWYTQRGGAGKGRNWARENRMNLFHREEFFSHSGKKLPFKIECDELSVASWDTIAWMISEKYKFHFVYGIPTGGIFLATLLQRYVTSDRRDGILLVDDVITTGASFKHERRRIFHDQGENAQVKGVAVFSRMHGHSIPHWITPIFQMWSEL
jgi:orotate phosphoribosyltransferase